VAFDVLYRYLRHLGYDVTYVRNFTGKGQPGAQIPAASGSDWRLTIFRGFPLGALVIPGTPFGSSPRQASRL
jgi:hypothetical protein